MRRRGPWTRQPPAGTPIDWGNPLGEGLIAAYPFNSFTDYVGRNNLGPSANAVLAGGVRGLALTRTTTTIPGNSASRLPVTGSGALSAFVLFRTANTSTTANANYLCLFGGNASGGTFALSVEAGVLWARNNGDTAHAGTGFDDGLWHSYGWTKPSGATEAGVAIYGDGVALPTTVSGTDVLDFGGSAPLCLGANPNTAATGFIGQIGLFALWTRVLTRPQVLALARAPWQLFLPPRRRVYSLPSAPGAPSSPSVLMPGFRMIALGGPRTP